MQFFSLCFPGTGFLAEPSAGDDQAPTNPAESEVFYNEKIKPLFKEASQYLERAWEADNDNVDALRYLENVYYNLQDETMMKDVEQRKNR